MSQTQFLNDRQIFCTKFIQLPRSARANTLRVNTLICWAFYHCLFPHPWQLSYPHHWLIASSPPYLSIYLSCYISSLESPPRSFCLSSTPLLLKSFPRKQLGHLLPIKFKLFSSKLQELVSTKLSPLPYFAPELAFPLLNVLMEIIKAASVAWLCLCMEPLSFPFPHTFSVRDIAFFMSLDCIWWAQREDYKSLSCKPLVSCSSRENTFQVYPCKGPGF